MACIQDYPATYNFTVYQGDTFQVVLTWESGGSLVDLTGWTASMVAWNGSTIVQTWNLANGGIVLGGALGTITLNTSGVDTAALAPMNGNYDLLMTNGGDTTALLAGSFTVRKGRPQ